MYRSEGQAKPEESILPQNLAAVVLYVAPLQLDWHLSLVVMCNNICHKLTFQQRQQQRQQQHQQPIVVVQKFITFYKLHFPLNWTWRAA